MRALGMWLGRAALAATLIGAVAPAAPVPYAPVIPGQTLQFPRDFGSHPRFRTEWWYVTGWLDTPEGESLGFQITFFRTKPDTDQDNPSAFAPRQLLIAHCAISDPQLGRLWQDQRIRRTGMGLVEAGEGDTHLDLDGWSLHHGRAGYTAAIAAENFSLHLELKDDQPPLLHGEAGVSRKGPAMGAASYYYSLPQMQVAGHIQRGGRGTGVSGRAWFDHEWSSEYLDPDAVGWDWVGINLQDGGALMAFRIRDAAGGSRWAGGTLRDADGTTHILSPADVAFTSTGSWRSSRTGVTYPVRWRLRAGPKQLDLVPLMEDQENDTRLSTGAIYWEGAIRAVEHRQLQGRGYLELTGYGERLRLR